SVPEMMTFLQTHGLKVICWLTPLVNNVSKQGEVPGQAARAATFDAGVAGHFFVQDAAGQPLVVHWWKGQGGAVDFTKPEARQWFLAQLQQLVDQSKVVTASGASVPAIGGFKTDDGEAATNKDSHDTPGGVYIPENARYADGRTGREMRNGYCLEYHRAVASVLG